MPVPNLYTVNSKGENVRIKLHNVGSASFECPNCGREFTRTLWEHDYGDDDFGHVAGYANCSCGAKLMVADTLETVMLFWLNEKEMRTER